ncbi:LuxR C-terminal-related transcriptional regulator [Rhizobium sp. EC-SD404]|uniref:response regulator transcription factor n=1 Tax=Rhizobium sp. EC-SD404 TaxID=2038389 RepID=UPI0012552D28
MIAGAKRSPSEAQCLHELRASGLHLPVIFVVDHGDVKAAVAALKAGAADYLQFPFEAQILLGAARAALNATLTKNTSDLEQSQLRARLSRLTPREVCVLRGVVDDRPNKLIAHELDISPRTVEVHRASVMTKMNARSVAELVRTVIVVEGDAAIHNLPPNRQNGASH